MTPIARCLGLSLATLSLATLSLATLGLALTLPLAGCGGTDTDCDPSCDGQKVRCRQVGSELTALGAITAAQASASVSLGTGARWVGAIKGLRITRAGHPTTVPDSELFGVKLYTAGWVFKYCANLDELVYSAGPEFSSAQRGCGTLDCAAVSSAAPPTIDSPAAVSAAFPGDPNNTLYQLDFNLMLNNDRIWTVTRLSDVSVVHVNADSGAVVP